MAAAEATAPVVAEVVIAAAAPPQIVVVESVKMAAAAVVVDIKFEQELDSELELKFVPKPYSDPSKKIAFVMATIDDLAFIIEHFGVSIAVLTK